MTAPKNRLAARPGEPLRFYLEQVQRETSGCIIWPYELDNYGYGRVRYEGRKRSVHQLACAHTNGPRPEGLVVRHLCGPHTQACFNPRHLIWGTPAENMQDQIDKGERARGERHGRTHLTEVQVREIEADRRTLVAIASEYRIAVTTVGHIKAHRTWRHLWLEG